MSTPGSAPETGFNEWLDQVCKTRNSNLCVGLDPDCQRVLALVGHPVLSNSDLCVSTIFTAASAAASSCAAFKPNAAFFEALEDDVPLLPKVGEYLTKLYPDIIALCDAKRGDIGNTSAHYAKAVFENQHFHALTVNPLMGYDAVEPFLRNPKRGIFLLCLTSNPGADDFLLQNELYLRIAEKAVKWNTNGNVGLVVGATRPEYLNRIRGVAPDLPLLIPGVGVQGGKLDETIDAINGREIRRFLINASRSILYPDGSTWENYAEKVGAAARQLRDQINSQLAV